MLATGHAGDACKGNSGGVVADMAPKFIKTEAGEFVPATRAEFGSLFANGGGV